ncbi:MAG: hypothetical protein JW908_04920 [Anaerolineales bacterium]|nr:hypothetical protein [Anaerolineales bacterium]
MLTRICLRPNIDKHGIGLVSRHMGSKMVVYTQEQNAGTISGNEMKHRLCGKLDDYVILRGLW